MVYPKQKLLFFLPLALGVACGYIVLLSKSTFSGLNNNNNNNNNNKPFSSVLMWSFSTLELWVDHLILIIMILKK